MEVPQVIIQVIADDQWENQFFGGTYILGNPYIMILVWSGMWSNLVPIGSFTILNQAAGQSEHMAYCHGHQRAHVIARQPESTPQMQTGVSRRKPCLPALWSLTSPKP